MLRSGTPLAAARLARTALQSNLYSYSFSLPKTHLLLTGDMKTEEVHLLEGVRRDDMMTEDHLLVDTTIGHVTKRGDRHHAAGLCRQVEAPVEALSAVSPADLHSWRERTGVKHHLLENELLPQIGRSRKRHLHQACDTAIDFCEQVLTSCSVCGRR